MKKFISLVSIFACFFTANAQYVGDAIRYSQNFPTLTARSMGMGGAFTSLGGDFSSAYINPAGLGVYRKSEFVFSPGLNYSKTKADFIGQTNDDFKYQAFVSNFGYVGTYNTNKDKGLVSASYAIGYNRLNNFGNYSYIRGENSSNSLADYFMEYAEGYDPETLDAFYERLAFDAYVIDTVPGSSYEYQTPVWLPVSQRRTIETKGGTGEWIFAFGLNISNVFYIGMGMGINHLNYEQTMVHSEYDDNNLSDIDHFHYTEKLDVEGTGFTMNIGAMARLFQIVRVGASLHLPTYYRIDEDYMNSMYSVFDDGFVPSEVNGAIYAEGTFEYKLNTPLKVSGGASVQLGKRGIVSADIEYIDYSGMRLRERDAYTDFSSSNDEIETTYDPVVNLRIGGEFRMNNLSVRLGGGYYPSPYSDIELNKDADYGEITTGFGYRNSNFFCDLGFSALLHKEKYNLYSAYGLNNIADLNQQKYRFTATMGFRF